MEIKYKNQIFSADVKKRQEDWLLKLNGESIEINAKKNNDNSFSIINENATYLAYSVETESHFFVNIDGEIFTFDKINPEEKSYTSGSTASSDIDVIKPPMPGSIVKILVANEQKVAEGDGLIIVEAMKMETTLYSSINGIVSEINVKPGEQVDSDKILMIIKK